MVTSVLKSLRPFTPGLKLVAMGILEKISDIEREIARTQKNKGKTKT